MLGESAFFLSLSLSLSLCDDRQAAHKFFFQIVGESVGESEESVHKLPVVCAVPVAAQRRGLFQSSTSPLLLHSYVTFSPAIIERFSGHAGVLQLIVI
jgi:hypothetical protein